MVSNLKRNKQLINYLKDYLYNNFKGDKKIRISGDLDADIFKVNGETTPVSLRFVCTEEVKKDKFIVVEDSKNRVYIALDTKRGEITSVEDSSYYSSSGGVGDSKNFGLEVKNLLRTFGQSTQYSESDYFHYFQACYINEDYYNKMIQKMQGFREYGDICTNARTMDEHQFFKWVETTKMYKTAQDVYMDLFDRSKFSFVLKPKLFRTIEGNRNIIPILTLNFDKEIISYTYSSSAYTDRELRDSIFLTDALSHKKWDNRWKQPEISHNFSIAVFDAGTIPVKVFTD